MCGTVSENLKATYIGGGLQHLSYRIHIYYWVTQQLICTLLFRSFYSITFLFHLDSKILAIRKFSKRHDKKKSGPRGGNPKNFTPF